MTATSTAVQDSFTWLTRRARPARKLALALALALGSAWPPAPRPAPRAAHPAARRPAAAPRTSPSSRCRRRPHLPAGIRPVFTVATPTTCSTLLSRLCTGPGTTGTPSSTTGSRSATRRSTATATGSSRSRSRHYAWSDGETVRARDVGFWINLLKANKADWAYYVPGGFPDNVVSWGAHPRHRATPAERQLQPVLVHLQRAVADRPLPIASDRTSLSAPAPSPAAVLPDTTRPAPGRCTTFLTHQATRVSSYTSGPIWSVVDGPWKLTGLTSDGIATFVPNRSSRAARAALTSSSSCTFTSSAAEFWCCGPATRAVRRAALGQQISVGYVPTNDLPQQPALRSQGYQLIRRLPVRLQLPRAQLRRPEGQGNMRSSSRQAFQHLIDQTGSIRALYNGLGVPAYSPVPAAPASPSRPPA